MVFDRGLIEPRKSFPLPNARAGAGAYDVSRRNTDPGPRWDGKEPQCMFYQLITEEALDLSTIVSRFLLQPETRKESLQSLTGMRHV